MGCLHATGGGQTNGPGGTDSPVRQGRQGAHHTEWHLGLSQAFEAELLEVHSPCILSQRGTLLVHGLQGTLTICERRASSDWIGASVLRVLDIAPHTQEVSVI
jgi:hypothetical protein